MPLPLPALPPAPWVAHQGDDYTVVMLPGENTETASIRIGGGDRDADADLAIAIAALPGIVVALSPFAQLLALVARAAPDDMPLYLAITAGQFRAAAAALVTA